DARRNHGVADRHRELALERASGRGLDLSTEQRGALEHVISARGVSNVIGYAGTGKSAMLGVAREAWEAAGYQVQGAALSGIAAEGLEHGSGIGSRTLASLEHQWANDRELLSDKHILVIDEAGMIGTRQLERVVTEAEKQGAKVVLVGDPEQLQAIEAGAAFRAAAERHGAVEISAIRRQHEEWQRDATCELATGRTGEAIGRYADAGHAHAADTREAARTELVDAWDRDRQRHPDASRIILTHTNDEVRQLNEDARDRLRAGGTLGEDVAIKVERGDRSFADGDRVMFLRNERDMGVKNGSLGTVQNVDRTRMAVMLDDGRSVAFDLKDYAHIDHGYAATIHKAQGMTVDRVQVLATPGMDRHGAYVAMTRHRESVDLHYGRDDFRDQSKLVRTLSRERGKDMASDYRVRALEPAKAAEPKRSMFAGLKLRPTVSAASLGKAAPQKQQPERTRNIRVSARALSPAADRSALDKAVERYARAQREIDGMHAKGLSPVIHQQKSLNAAARDIDALRSDGAKDFATALRNDPSLTAEAASGRTQRAMEAMRTETKLRIDAPARADRFVAEWQASAKQLREHKANYDDAGAKRVGAHLNDMAKSLHRDPQLESLLRNRTHELGLKSLEKHSVSQALQDYLRPSRSLGMGL
ncbi:MAG: AAA family ATPase, partial [Alphaproteobacteria bacterium]|nr:AAA family ATPase [Alphaproteobacteria bacterium]